MAEIKVKRSSVPGKVPAITDLALGEIAINTYDGIAFIKKDVSGTQTVVPLGGGSGTVTSVSGTGSVSGLTLTGTVTNSGSLVLGGVLTLTSGNVTSALGFTPYNASNPSGYITSSDSITGNAATATVLQTGRTIALTGDVSYTSGSFNGSANVTGTATLASVGTAGTYTKVTTDAKGRVTSGTTLAATDIPNLDAAKITSGVIDPARLPSYVDDVIEAANLALFPATGETGKIYVALDTNKTYRWSGSAYIFITSGAVDSVAGKTGVVTLVAADVGLGNVENKSSATIRGEITSTNVTTALGFTPYNASNPSGYITSSGTAANVSGTVAIANGGTGQTTRQAAMDALAGSVTAGQYLRGDGTDVVMSAIQAADVPTLNQNTTGTAANVTGIVAIANGGTGATSAAAALTALGAYAASNPSGFITSSSTSTLTNKTINNGTLESYQEKVQVIGTVSTSTFNIDLSLANIFDITLGANVTFTFTNPPASNFSKPATIILRQGSAGNRTATFTNAKYTDGALPQLSTGANHIDVLTFFTVNGGGFWFGTFAMANVS
jgi:hypothetical protein